MATLFGSDDYKDLPVMTAKQVSKYYRPYDKLDDVPPRYLMETDDFLMHFNTRATPYSPVEPLTRSTLQFYSSPRVRLFPLPVYRNRHTAHYIVPDHFNRLAVICVARDKFFMPIKMIHKLVELLPGDNYRFLEEWPGTVRDLMEAIPLLGRGFKPEDLLRFVAVKLLVLHDSPAEVHRDTLESFMTFKDEHLKKFIREQIEKKSRRLYDWVAEGSGAPYIREMAKSLSGAETPEEYAQKMIGSKKFVERAAKERAEKPRMHPR